MTLNTTTATIFVTLSEEREEAVTLWVHDSGRWWLTGHEALESFLRSLPGDRWTEWLADMWALPDIRSLRVG
jgi:hypothetical protein